MFERKSDKLIPFHKFVIRFILYFFISILFISSALMIGVAGYHWIAGLSWTDSLLNASMILSGMGPVDEMKTAPAKIFASFYALFCGLIFVLAMGIVLSPLIHRTLHILHLGDRDLI
ncbi:MAG: hypothetical protein AB7I27_13410 [Bacteriovoracaceae bacterium]